MKTKKIICVSCMSFLLTALGITSNVLAREVKSIQPDARAESQASIDPNTFVVEDLGSGTATDLYRVSCAAECIRADVNDAGPFDDTRFKVNINGSSPGFVGNASAINPTGGLSLVAELCSGQNTNSSRRAYVEFSEVNAAGAENYDTIITCRTAAGGIINPTIIKILDQ